MAEFKFVGVGPKGEAQERTFDTGFGRSVTVSTGDVFHTHLVGFQHLSPDLVPNDAPTRHQIQLLQESVDGANARDYAAGAAPQRGV